MTMQTFVILLIGITCGYKIGLAIVTLYLLEGIFGLPVFAGTPEKGVGLIYFTGPTMGYLIGFLLAVYFASYDYNKIINKIKDAGMEIYDISTEEGNLEDVFIDLTKN